MHGLTDAALEGRDGREAASSPLRRLRSAFLIAGLCACLGTAIPYAAQQSFSGQFRAETHLVMRDASPSAVRAAVERLRSKPVLDNLVRALNLGGGDEFAANRPTVMRVVSEVLSGEVTTMSQAEEALRQRLANAVSVTYDAARQRLVISATAADPGEAAAIANRLADEFERAVVTASSSRSNPQVDAMRGAADRAEAALSGYVAKLGTGTIGQLQKYHDDRNAMAVDIQAARLNLAALEKKQELAAALKFDDVLSKPLPDSLEFTGLEYQRQRYVQAQLDLEQLSASLGPRHPKRAAAQAALDDAGRDIGTAITRLATSLKDQRVTAEKTLADLRAGEKTVLQDPQLAESYNQLSVLQVAADEASRNLDRAENESASLPPAVIPSVQVSRAASADAVTIAADRSHPQTMTLAAAGGIVGLAIGLAFVAFGYRRQMRLAEEAFEAPVSLDIDEPHAEIPAAASPVELLSFADVDAPPEDEPAEERIAANETAFGDQIRALLLEHSRPAAEAGLPSLLASVVDESRSRRGDELAEHQSLWARARAVERIAAEQAIHADADHLHALQQELAELREIVQFHSARQLKATG